MFLAWSNLKSSICYVKGQTDLHTHHSPTVKEVIFYIEREKGYLWVFLVFSMMRRLKLALPPKGK